MAWDLRKPTISSGWTIETLLEYVNARITDMELRNQQRFDAQVNAGVQRNADMELRQQQRFEAQTRAIEAAITAQRAAIDAALVSADRATAKAEAANERRFESVNEFRQTLSDQAAHFITRTEVEAATARNTERIQELAVVVRGLATKAEVINAYERMESRLQQVEKAATLREGKGSGLTAGWGYIATAVAIIASVIATYFIIQHGGTVH